MKRLSLILALCSFLCACGQKHAGKAAFIMYSQHVKDSFDIYITLPKDYKANEQHSVFYYLDANIKSGNKIREILRDSALKQRLAKTIFVGIGHRGNFHELRRRDFTVPEVAGKDTFGFSANFGQINRFYQFMKTELIPYMTGHYQTDPSNNSLLGHSFGGLFTIYALFQQDTVFKHFYALSPSLWVSNYSIYTFNKLDGTPGIKQDLFFAAGSLEVLNRIKAGTDQLDTYLQNKKYPALDFKYKIYAGETHNSAVPDAIRDILCGR